MRLFFGKVRGQDKKGTSHLYPSIFFILEQWTPTSHPQSSETGMPILTMQQHPYNHNNHSPRSRPLLATFAVPHPIHINSSISSISILFPPLPILPPEEKRRSSSVRNTIHARMKNGSKEDSIQKMRRTNANIRRLKEPENSRRNSNDRPRN